MKKIVGIIAALALAGAVFADAPSVAPVVAEFDGNAKLEWIADLDAETTGMKNSTEAKFKIKFVTEGTKATEGDGLWGELEIKAGNWEIAYGEGDAVVTGVKYGFGGQPVEVDWKGNTYEVVWDAEADAPKDVYKDKDGNEITVAEWDPAPTSPEEVMAYFAPKTVMETKKVLGVPGAPSVEKAVIHFVDGDFSLSMNIKKPDLSFGGGKPTLATKSDRADDKGPVVFPKVEPTLTNANGFTLNLGTSIADVEFAFADNGEKKSGDKEFAFKLGATLKLVENLNIFGGVAYSTEEEKFVAAAKVDYKYEIDDTFYLKPAVLFTMKNDVSTNLAAAILFGWGAENEEPGFVKFFDDAESVPDKCSNGVSVFVNTDLKDDDKKTSLLIGAYDSTLIASVLPGFKVGVQVATESVKDFSDEFLFDAAIKYSNTFGIVKLSADFGLEMAKDVNTIVYGAEIGTSELIQNTDLYVNYKGQADGDSIHGGDKKGKVTVGAKIHF